MKKIVITYNDKEYIAVVTGDYEAMLISDYKGVLSGDKEENEVLDLKLDQCRGCGVWCSQDDEIYGDGYCTNCATMCDDCQRYFYYKDLATEDEMWFSCQECLKK